MEPESNRSSLANFDLRLIHSHLLPPLQTHFVEGSESQGVVFWLALNPESGGPVTAVRDPFCFTQISGWVPLGVLA